MNDKSIFELENVTYYAILTYNSEEKVDQYE